MTTMLFRSLASAAVAVLVLAANAAAAPDPSRVPTAPEGMQLVAAGDPVDHAALAEQFAALAQRYTSRADDHTAIARAYLAAPRTHFDAVDHCNRLAKRLRASAKEATDAAALHWELARVAR